MRKLGDKLLVAVYLAVAMLPVLAMLLHIEGRTVNGALPPTPRAKLRWHTVRSEEYQQKLTAWFESRLGLKGTSIAVDNGVLYRVFRETKPGARVAIGDDGVLFTDDDIAYFNKHGGDLPSPTYLDQLADKIAKAQRQLADRGRALVPVLIPSKTSIWRDKVPARWRAELGAEPPSDVHVYRATLAALDRHHVRYVDARALLTHADSPRVHLYAPDGRHWSRFGACHAMKEIVRVQAELVQRAMLPYTCELETSTGHRFVDTDYDLWRLLNAYGVKTGAPRVARAKHRPPPPGTDRPSALVIATSFGWELLEDAERTGLFSRLDLDYYDETLFTFPERTSSKVEPGTPGWRATVLGRDLYVLDLFETYLGAPTSYIDKFLDELAPELSREH